MARSSSKKRQAKKKSRGATFSAVLIVVCFAAAALVILHLARTQKTREWFQSRFKQEEPVAPELMALRVEQAARQALSDLGVAEEQLSVEEGNADGAVTGHKMWEAPLPPGVTLERANLSVTNAVVGVAGRILDGREWKDKRKRRRCLTLIAAADSTPCLELRFYETAAARKDTERSPAKLAIVIGEMGRGLDDPARRLMESPFDFTVAVLPGRSASKETVRLAGSRGKEVLLHLPMEPDGYPRKSPGEGAVLLDQSEKEIGRIVRDHIEDLGNVSGVVNYMGSAGTRDRDLMRAVLGELAKSGLFFMDSSSSAHSVGCEIAAKLGVHCLQNDLFLEVGREGSGLLEKRLDRAERIALQRGVAVVMAGPSEELLEAISSRAGSFESKGIVLVKVSDLIED